MRHIQRAIRAMIGGLCAVTALQAASAEVQPGFYVGLGAGQAYFDIKKSELDSAVQIALLSQGLFPTSASSTLEDSDTTLSLFAGYHFNPYIAVEAGYVDLGTAEYRSVGTVNPPGPVVSAPTSFDFDIESKGITVAALGSLPLGESIDLHGHLGFMFGNTDITGTARLGSTTGVETESLESVNAFLGVGAGLNLGQHWSLSLDWTRYANVGDENDDDDVRTEAGFDVDALSFSAMFRF
jgi:OOP family OmpA-OmpF porin